MAEQEGFEPTPAFTPALFSKQIRQTNIRLCSKILMIIGLRDLVANAHSLSIILNRNFNRYYLY